MNLWLVVKTYFSSIAAEKDKVTTFCFPELETQATCSISSLNRLRWIHSFQITYPVHSAWLTKHLSDWQQRDPSLLGREKGILSLLLDHRKLHETVSQPRCCHWPLPPSASSRQPLRQWSSLPKAPWDCSSSYSWSRKSRLLLLGNPRMVNLWDTLVHCSRFAATLSYSSVAPGKSSDSSLKGQRTVVARELRYICWLRL